MIDSNIILSVKHLSISEKIKNGTSKKKIELNSIFSNVSK